MNCPIPFGMELFYYIRKKEPCDPAPVLYFVMSIKKIINYPSMRILGIVCYILQ